MGQKVHPEVLRVGYIHDWKSTWFNEKEFSDYLLEDVRIRDHITGKLAHAGLSEITIPGRAVWMLISISFLFFLIVMSDRPACESLPLMWSRIRMSSSR